MPQGWRKLLFGFAAVVVLTGAAIARLRSAGPAPAVSLALLGYTNRVGPYALVAITNCSASAITLQSSCLVLYSPTPGSAPRCVTSIDANTFRVTRLLPHEGLVQEVFVFPGKQAEWQFECSAAYSSTWLEVGRFTENRLRTFFHARFPLTSKAWREFKSDWFTCPP